MSFCSNCGKEVSEDTKFCPECGQRLKEGFTPEARQAYIEELKASIGEQKPAEKTGITKKKLAGIIIGCVIVVFVVLAIAIPSEPTSPPTTPPSTTQPTPTPTPTPPPTFEPIVVTGSGDKTSPPFTVTTGEWIIDWSYVPDTEYPEYAVFSFFVYPRGETALYVESMLFPETTTGSTYSYAGPGEYYIKVGAANIKSWKVVISAA